jgi:ferredoxin-NADP reductase
MSLLGSLHKQEPNESQTHKVFITHGNGIFSAFNMVIDSLKSEITNDLTLIYITPEQPAAPLFKAELELLERRFNGRLLVYFIDSYQVINDECRQLKQELLEVVINSNTKPQMHFYLIGNDDFIDQANHCLLFLGVSANDIIQKIN